MIRQALAYLFGGLPAQFDSALAVNAAVARLQAASWRMARARPRAMAAVGEVAPDDLPKATP